jgi:tetratricopeptide (TPR) repeat protein
MYKKRLIDHDFENKFNLCLRLFSYRKYQDAHDLLVELLGRELMTADRGRAYFTLAETYEKLNNLDEAIVCYEASARYYPGNIFVYRRLKNIYKSQNLRYKFFLLHIAYWKNSLSIFKERYRFHERQSMWEE